MGRNRTRSSRKQAQTNKPVKEKSDIEDALLSEEINLQNLSLQPETPSNEVSFRSYKVNSARVQGRRYFVSSLCQVCKGDVCKGGVTCAECDLVSYCSAEHMRAHAAEHRDLCAAVGAVRSARGAQHVLEGAQGTSPDAYRLLRYHNMADCEQALGRPLESCEREMFIFPRVCETCHEHRRSLLTVCPRCEHTAYCRDSAHCPQNHRDCCEYLQRYRRVVRDQALHGHAKPDLPVPSLSPVLPALTGMEQFFSPVRDALQELEYLELTEQSTYPLTALSAVSALAELRGKAKLTLHVIGAEAEFETDRLEKWEYYLLHLLPSLEHLEVDFIGPELNTAPKPRPHRTCRHCREVKKSLSFRLHRCVYHEAAVHKPDLVCAFNPGLYRSTGYNGQDSWAPTVRTILTNGSPLVTTAYTAKEASLDLSRLRALHPSSGLSVLTAPRVNPFSSIKPSLNFVSDEELPVIFKNHFYCIVK